MEQVRDRILVIYCSACDHRDYEYAELVKKDKEDRCVHCGNILKVVWVEIR